MKIRFFFKRKTNTSNSDGTNGSFSSDLECGTSQVKHLAEQWEKKLSVLRDLNLIDEDEYALAKEFGYLSSSRHKKELWEKKIEMLLKSGLISEEESDKAKLSRTLNRSLGGY